MTGNVSTSRSQIRPTCPTIRPCAGITVHQLLTRTGGVPDPWHGMSEEEIRAVQSISFGEFVGVINSTDPIEPDWGAGLNYVLLPRLVELVPGQSYEDYLIEHIFDPLEMNHTSYCDLADHSRERAIGYEPDLTCADTELYSLNSVEGRHGFDALCTTAEDLFRWSTGLTPGVFLSVDTLEKWFTAHVSLEAHDFENYCYGVFIPNPDHEQRRSIVAAGIGPGSVVFMRWYPDEEILVLSLRNTADTGTWAAWSVSGVLANIAQSYTTTPGGGQRESTKAPLRTALGDAPGAVPGASRRLSEGVGRVP